MSEFAYIVADIETDSLRAPESCQIIQIAALACRGREVVDQIDLRLDFDREKADPRSLEMNSYDPAVWAARQISQAAGVHQLGRFLDEYAEYPLERDMAAYVIGHNFLAFDGPRLDHFLRKAFPSVRMYYQGPYNDTLRWARRLGWDPKPASFKLVDLAKHFYIDASGAHDALRDVEINAEVAWALADKQKGKAA